MFALLALICFIVALFASPGIDLVTLGLVFVAAHLLVGPWWFGTTPPWTR